MRSLSERLLGGSSTLALPSDRATGPSELQTTSPSPLLRGMPSDALTATMGGSESTEGSVSKEMDVALLLVSTEYLTFLQSPE